METTNQLPETLPQIDESKLENFIGKVITDCGAMVGGTLTFIGDKLGFFKAMADSKPVDSIELAAKTKTNERYVREWLINQAAGGYLEYDPATKKFSLPPEHAIALTEELSPFFVAGGFQTITALIKDEERITDLFRNGKGMLWGEHHHDLFHGTERFFKPGYYQNLVQVWIPAMKGVEQKLESGAVVADVGCGHGVSTLIMAKHFPKSTFYGYDFHKESIERARELASSENIFNVHFEVADATNYSDKQFDFITYFDCLHDMGDPIGALKHANKCLKPDGTIMLVEPMAGDNVEDNFNPVGRVFSGASVLVCSPNAMASGGYVMGTVATDKVQQEVANQAGFKSFRRAAENPTNRIFEIRK